MYKLLTEDQRKIVAREYKLRRTIVMLWALIAVAIIGIAGLFPSYILSNAREKEVKERLDVMGNTELPAEDRELFSWLSSFNLKLKVLAPRFDMDKPSLLVEKVVSVRGSGVRITGLDWLKEDGIESLTISGIARDRQALTAYERALEEGGLGEATLPVSNLAKDRDIAFTVKLIPNKAP